MLNKELIKRIKFLQKDSNNFELPAIGSCQAYDIDVRRENKEVFLTSLEELSGIEFEEDLVILNFHQSNNSGMYNFMDTISSSKVLQLLEENYESNGISEVVGRITVKDIKYNIPLIGVYITDNYRGDENEHFISFDFPDVNTSIYSIEVKPYRIKSIIANKYWEEE